MTEIPQIAVPDNESIQIDITANGGTPNRLAIHVDDNPQPTTVITSDSPSWSWPAQGKRYVIRLKAETLHPDQGWIDFPADPEQFRQTKHLQFRYGNNGASPPAADLVVTVELKEESTD